MDYALGFFEKIAGSALEKVSAELIADDPEIRKTRNSDQSIFSKCHTPKTGWIRKHSEDLSDADDDQNLVYTIQAHFFIDNFTTTVVQIINHLLYREPAPSSVRNIEFSDAVNRLTDDKLDKIISQEGPFRARSAIQLILQAIYIY